MIFRKVIVHDKLPKVFAITILLLVLFASFQKCAFEILSGLN